MFKRTALFVTALSFFLAGKCDALHLDVSNTEETSQSWYGLAANRDGDQLNGITFHGEIFRSENGGNTWVQSTQFSGTEGRKNFVDIASNGKGDQVYSVDYNGGIWKSENGGIDWKMIPATSGKLWSAIATNEKGNIVVASVDGENLWVSNDSGKTWEEKTNYSTDETHPWVKLACNLKGDKMIAVADKGGLYTSSDFGKTWKENSNLDKDLRWNSVDMNDDGNQLYATAENKLWASNDFGKSWVEKQLKIPKKVDDKDTEEDEEAKFWSQFTAIDISYVSCNGKGNSVSFVTEYDNIYISDDYGVTFSPVLDPQVAMEFPWAYPVVNKNGVGLTIAQNPGIILSTREESQKMLASQKNSLVIDNVDEVESALKNNLSKMIEEAQNELDAKTFQELEDTIDEMDREIYGTENIYFEKTGVDERDMDEVFAEIIANFNVENQEN